MRDALTADQPGILVSLTFSACLTPCSALPGRGLHCSPHGERAMIPGQLMRGEDRAPTMDSLASHFSGGTISVLGDFNECGPAARPRLRRGKNVVAPTRLATGPLTTAKRHVCRYLREDGNWSNDPNDPHVAHDSPSQEVQHG